MNEQQAQQMYNAYESAIAKAEAAQVQANAVNYSSALAAQANKPNIVEWELDFKQELEEIERLLRCDILQRDRDGNEYYIKNPDDSIVFLNELGVNDVLRKIRMLVNKNKVLSNYNIEEIKLRVKIIMHEIRCLLYNNYEQYGIDNDYKMNNYSMIVLTIGSLIEDAYRRAMNGETHKGLNEQRLLTQHEPLGNQQQMPMMSQKKTHWYTPWRKS